MKDSEIASQPTGTVLRALKAAAPQTVPVFAGYLVLGLSLIHISEPTRPY